MKKIRFAECKKCGTLHYIVDDKVAKNLEEQSALYLEFSNRSFKTCANCGSSDYIHEITEDDANEYSSGDSLPPILLSDK